MEARWTNAWRELQSRLSLSSPAPQSGERVVVILIHQKLLFHLRPSYCAFDFCFCFCRVSLILLSALDQGHCLVLFSACPPIYHYSPLLPQQPQTTVPLFFFVPLRVFGTYWHFCAISIFYFISFLLPGEALSQDL